MMNIVKLQDQLKNFSQEQLISAMQMPDGSTPQYLVLGEIMRRKQMETAAAGQPAPESTVAEDAVAAAGVPQGGIADMARALAPKTDMAQNTGIQAMASGGPVKKMAAGDLVVIRGKRFIRQADNSLLPEGEAPPAAEAPMVPEVDRARAAGQESFTLGELLPDFGIDINLSGTGQQAVPGGGRLPVPMSEPAPTDAGAVPAETPEQMLKRRSAAQDVAPTTPAAPAAPVAPQGGGGGISGAGGMSPFEQQLMDALASREKAAKQDKWLALAQVGLNLMSSKEPTLLGAVGEAGLKGVEAARAARDQYDKDKLDLQTALEQSRMARAAAAARAASKASTSGIGGLKLKDYLGQLKNVTEVVRDSLTTLTGGVDPATAMAMAEEAGNLKLQSDIKTALDAVTQADNDYTSAVRSLNSGTAVPVEDDDGTNFSVRDPE